MSKKYLIIIVYFSFTLTVFSQLDGYPNTSLNVQPDPVLNGAGLLGVSNIAGRGLAFINNPAQLGNVKNNIELFGLLKSASWGKFWEPRMWGPEINDARSFVLGYDLKSSGLPITIGMGFTDNYNHFYGSDISGWVIEDSRAFGIGAKYSSIVDINLGINIKNYDQNTYRRNLMLTSYDFGVLITAPISKIFFPNFQFAFSKDQFINPKLNLSVGNTLLNVTDKKDIHGYRIGRIVLLGYSMEVGFDYINKDFLLSLFDYSFNVESEYNLLISSEYYWHRKGRSWNLNIIKSMVNLEGDRNNVIHKGHIFNVCETFTYSVGSSFYCKKCTAFAISSRGIFKSLGGIIENKTIGSILKKVYLEYSHSNINYDPILELDFEGITFGITEVI